MNWPWCVLAFALAVATLVWIAGAVLLLDAAVDANAYDNSRKTFFYSLLFVFYIAATVGVGVGWATA